METCRESFFFYSVVVAEADMIVAFRSLLDSYMGMQGNAEISVSRHGCSGLNGLFLNCTALCSSN